MLQRRAGAKDTDAHGAGATGAPHDSLYCCNTELDGIRQCKALGGKGPRACTLSRGEAASLTSK